jgi:hypothetical protein
VRALGFGTYLLQQLVHVVDVTDFLVSRWEHPSDQQPRAIAGIFCDFGDRLIALEAESLTGL